MLFLVKKKKGKKDEKGDFEDIPQSDISPSTDVTSLFLLGFLSVL